MITILDEYIILVIFLGKKINSPAYDVVAYALDIHFETVLPYSSMDSSSLGLYGNVQTVCLPITKHRAKTQEYYCLEELRS